MDDEAASDPEGVPYDEEDEAGDEGAGFVADDPNGYADPHHPFWERSHQTPHHVDGEEGGGGDQCGGGDGGGGKRSWPTEVGDELSGHSSTLRSLN